MFLFITVVLAWPAAGWLLLLQSVKNKCIVFLSVANQLKVNLRVLKICFRSIFPVVAFLYS